MPSRRSVLGACGLVALAGCTDLADLTSGPPAYTDWLYHPGRAFDAERVVYATLDADRLSEARESLPPVVDETVGRLDRQVSAVSFESLSRLVAIGHGSVESGRAGGVVVAEGEVDPAAVEAEFRMTREDDWTHEGRHRGHDLWAYEPSFLQGFAEYRGPDQERAPDVTLALGVAEGSLLVGGALDTDDRGVDAVRAALDAHADETTRYVSDSRPARDVTDVLEREPFAVGVSAPLVDRLAARVPDDRERLRSVLEDLRALGVGVRPGEQVRTTLALVYDPGAVASVENVRTLVEELTEGDVVDGDRSVSVGLQQSGRVVVVRATVDPEELLGDLEGLDLPLVG